MSQKTGLWMPIYWGDYLADTTHFTTFQHGCYLLLIAAYWRRGSAIPNDPQYLAQVCRTSCDKLARYGKPILAMFTCKDDLLYHKRIEYELVRSSNRLAAAVANGRAGGLAKSKLTTTTITKEDSTENIPSEILEASPIESPLPTGKNYEFDGKVVRLSQKDWNLWLKAYSYLDLRAELTARDAWLASVATEADRGRWFVSTSKYLANRNAEAKALRPSGVGGITRLPNGEVDMRSLGIV